MQLFGGAGAKTILAGLFLATFLLGESARSRESAQSVHGPSLFDR